MENSFSLLSLFTVRDLMTLFVSVILVFASILSWAIIIEKIRIWHYQKRNPVSVKSGDNLETIVERLKEYHKKTEPLRQFYLKKDKLSVINGDGTIDDIQEKIIKAIDDGQ